MPYKRVTDRYTARAKKAGFAARSVYKLEEIDRRLGLLHPGMRVLDLGASPGSWTQYSAQKVGAKGVVVAVDRNPLRVAIPPNVTVLACDVLAGDLAAIEALGPFGAVLSDMAPHTTGIRDADVANSIALVDAALAIAVRVLAPKATLLVKVFQGSGFEEMRARLRAHFANVRILKPEASKRESTEIYLAAIGKRP